MRRKIEKRGSGAVPGCPFQFIQKFMDIKRINELIAGKQWTAMLEELPEGEHTICFDGAKDLNSCKAVAYSFLMKEKGRDYSFNVLEKNPLSVKITVKNAVAS